MKNNTYNKIKQNRTYLGREQVRGVALIIGLMMLLVMTLLGLAAMRGTSMQERMAANAQQQTITFQGAEAAIRAVMNELRAITAAPSGTTQSVLITSLNNGLNPNSTQLATTQRTVTIGNNSSSTASMAYTGTGALAGYGSKFQSFNFTISATSSQGNTGAGATHEQGISRAAPALDTN